MTSIPRRKRKLSGWVKSMSPPYVKRVASEARFADSPSQKEHVPRIGSDDANEPDPFASDGLDAVAQSEVGGSGGSDAVLRGHDVLGRVVSGLERELEPAFGRPGRRRARSESRVLLVGGTELGDVQREVDGEARPELLVIFVGQRRFSLLAGWRTDWYLGRVLAPLPVVLEFMLLSFSCRKLRELLSGLLVGSIKPDVRRTVARSAFDEESNVIRKAGAKTATKESIELIGQKAVRSDRGSERHAWAVQVFEIGIHSRRSRK